MGCEGRTEGATKQSEELRTAVTLENQDWNSLTDAESARTERLTGVFSFKATPLVEADAEE